MIAPEYERLIQDVLDGVATPEEVARLETWLRSNEAGRARQKELAALFATLARVPLAEAPLDLGTSTLAGIVRNHERGASRATGTSLLASWRAQMMRRPALVLAMPFAAGLAVGVLVLGAWTGSFGRGASRNRTDVVASMTPAAGTPADEWNLAGSRVAARSWNFGASRFASIEVTGGGPLTIELSFDPAAIRAVSVHQSGPGAGAASLTPGGLALSPTGDASYLIEFRPAASAAPVRLTIRKSTPGTLSGLVQGLLPVPNTSSHGR